MKKIAMVLAAGVVAGCSFQYSDLNLWPERNVWVESFSTYPVNFTGSEPELVSSEYVDEKSVKYNEPQSTYVGNTVLSSKVYQINKYRENLLRSNMDGIMNSASVPDLILANKTYRVIGTAVVDGVEYRLFPSLSDKFVFMVKPDGQLYNEIGQIRNGRLAVLDATFVPTPDELRMFPVKNSKTEQTKPISGIDIKYDGIRDGKMWFMVLDYSQTGENGGSFQNVAFPKRDGAVINIAGNQIKILSADEQKIEYMVLK